jgi:hypothetical protein
MATDRQPSSVPRPLVDEFLHEFVQRAEAGTFRGEFALWVPGGVVCGLLVGAIEWMETLAQLRAAALASTHPQAAAELRDITLFHGAAATEVRGQIQREFPAAAMSTRHDYVHLRKVRVAGAAQLGLEGREILWRGRLTEVAGFSMGPIHDGEANEGT